MVVDERQIINPISIEGRSLGSNVNGLLDIPSDIHDLLVDDLKSGRMISLPHCQDDCSPLFQDYLLSEANCLLAPASYLIYRFQRKKNQTSHPNLGNTTINIPPKISINSFSRLGDY